MSEIESEEERILVSEIHKEMERIGLFEREQDNNMSRFVGHTMIEKYLISDDACATAIRDRRLEDCSADRMQSFTDLVNDLKVELMALKNDLTRNIAKNEEDKNECQRLEANSKNLEEMVAMQASATAGRVTMNMDAIEQNIKRRFKKEKSDLKVIMTTLFSDNIDVQNMIAEVIDTYFKHGPDKYHTFEYTDGILHNLGLLKKMYLFDIHPRNPFQLRLTQLT